MKNQIRHFATALGLVTVLGGSLVLAQNINFQETGKVPFAFRAGTESLPAGTYEVTRHDSRGLLRLENKDTGQGVFVQANIPKTGGHGQAELVFRCYGGNCFFSEAWFAQESFGHLMPASKLQKELAASSQKPRVTYISMR